MGFVCALKSSFSLDVIFFPSEILFPIINIVINYKTFLNNKCSVCVCYLFTFVIINTIFSVIYVYQFYYYLLTKKTILFCC